MPNGKLVVQVDVKNSEVVLAALEKASERIKHLEEKIKEAESDRDFFDNERQAAIQAMEDAHVKARMRLDVDQKFKELKTALINQQHQELNTLRTDLNAALKEVQASRGCEQEVATLEGRIALAIKYLNDGFKAPEEMRELALDALKGVQ